MISIDDFTKVNMAVGKIMSAEKMPDADKLLILKVDFGEDAPRQIVSGIALHFPAPETLVGRKFIFVTNLEPRIIRGFESQAMILAANSPEAFSLLEVDDNIPTGTALK
jgi:methionyl-tRNA synthetase